MQCDVTVSELFRAYHECRKTKRNTWNALKFEERLERNLMDLYYELVENRYRIGRSICFVVTRPKPREVWAADFRDRIVHHLLYNRYSERYYNAFIHDSYACIPHKGTLMAARRIEHFMRSVSDNYHKPAWYMKADIANFFVSIDKDILEGLLRRRIDDDWWMRLANQILHNDPREAVVVKSKQKLMNVVPRHKSLFNATKGKGLPIGNLSSQFFANVYLDELDQFVKHELKIRYYARYVDDMVLLADNPAALNEAYRRMGEFVEDKLKIRFHDHKKDLNRIECGINFVGYIIKPHRKYLRRTTTEKMYRTIREKPKGELPQTINSYFGMLRHVNGWKERCIAAGKIGAEQFDRQLTKMIDNEIRCNNSRGRNHRHKRRGRTRRKWSSVSCA